MESVIKSRTFYKYKELNKRHKEEGDFPIFESGVFVKGEPNKFKPEKNDWVFNVEGEEHVLNSAGHLNWQMSNIEKGWKVTPVYKGKIVLETGQMAGKEAHQFDVQFERVETEAPAEVEEPVVVKRAKDESTEIPF